jgi:Cytochrome P460
MKRFLLAAAVVFLALAVVAASPRAQKSHQAQEESPQPTYVSGQLTRPDNYREWVFLSSGLGMNYNATAGGPQQFTNVFVPPWAYRAFLSSGKWPEKTMFVLEERGAETKGSINKTGHFQSDLQGLAMEVKDASRFPDKWAYFSFSADGKTAMAMSGPKDGCWTCHNDNAAVEHTFVQFYPTLKPAAEKFGTYRQQADQAPSR